MLGEAFPQVAPELHASICELFRYDLAWVGRRDEWLAAASIAFTNTFNIQPLGNKIEELCLPKAALPADYSWPPIESSGSRRFLDPQFLPEVERLERELGEAKPNLVVPVGAKASWALLRNTKISTIRGAITSSTLIPGLKLLPTFHPAAILRQWSWRPIVVGDLMKASLEMGFAEVKRPARHILHSPSLREVEDWTRETLAEGPPLMAADTETMRGQVTMISFATAPNRGLVIPFVDKAKPGWSYWPSFEEEKKAWACVRALCESPIRKVWQNGLYDLQYLLPLGIRVSVDEDTMLRHHAELPEMQKGLGFLGAAYTSEPAWKTMRTEKADTEKRDE